VGKNQSVLDEAIMANRHVLDQDFALMAQDAD
jgi:hypothetical protein